MAAAWAHHVSRQLRQAGWKRRTAERKAEGITIRQQGAAVHIGLFFDDVSSIEALAEGIAATLRDKEYLVSVRRVNASRVSLRVSRTNGWVYTRD
jgi:hypothetical protein